MAPSGRTPYHVIKNRFCCRLVETRRLEVRYEYNNGWELEPEPELGLEFEPKPKPKRELELEWE